MLSVADGRGEDVGKLTAEQRRFSPVLNWEWLSISRRCSSRSRVARKSASILKPGRRKSDGAPSSVRGQRAYRFPICNNKFCVLSLPWVCNDECGGQHADVKPSTAPITLQPAALAGCADSCSA